MIKIIYNYIDIKISCFYYYYYYYYYYISLINDYRHDCNIVMSIIIIITHDNIYMLVSRPALLSERDLLKN